MKTNKTLIIVLIAVAVVAAAAACILYFGNFGREAVNENANVSTNEPLIGGQKDAHGCLIAAGYSWCESKQKCLRIWEEPCYEAEEAALAQIFASEHEETIARTHVRVNMLQNNFAAGSISFGEVAGEGGAFLARLLDGAWAVDYEGNGSIDCPKVRDLGYPEEVLVGFCDVICAADAKLCSDGSYVGRVAPNCEFAPCPVEKAPAKTTISFLVSTGDKLKYCNGADMASEEFGKTITKTMTKEISGADLSRNELMKQSIIAASEEENLKTVIDQGNDFLKIVGDTAYLAPTDGWAGVSIFLCAWKPLVEVNLLNFSEIKNIVWVEDQQEWEGLK